MKTLFNYKAFHWVVNWEKVFNGMVSRNRFHPIIGILRKYISIFGRGSVSRARVSFLALVVSHFLALSRRNGISYSVRYLKSCYVLTHQAAGGHILDNNRDLGLAVKVSRQGIPRIIPRQLRALIIEGHPTTLRFVLSVFSIYRVITFKGKLKLHTITAPGKEVDLNRFNNDRFFDWFNPDKRRCEFRIRLDPILTSSPTSFLAKAFSSVSFMSLGPLRSSSPFNMVWSIGALPPKVYDSLIKWLTITDNDFFADIMDNIRAAFGVNSLPSGKLSVKHEAAGKERVFAMVDCWTQWILRPLHFYLMNLLRTLPTDGTFDQLKPVKVLLARGHQEFFSFDLSAATDRLPVDLQVKILSSLIGSSLANLWKTILVGRPYHFKGENLYYAVGQPMGALSSWPMLAVCHHYIVHLAWRRYQEEVGETLFPPMDYAILGDDLVIANRPLAGYYLEIMKELGVEINLSKSLISQNGTLEFAKRAYVRGVDVSPISLKEIWAANNSLPIAQEMMRKYQLSLGQLLDILHKGYRVKASLMKPLLSISVRVRSLLLLIKWPEVKDPVNYLFMTRFKSWTRDDRLLKPLCEALTSEIFTLRARIVDALSSIHPETLLGNLVAKEFKPSKSKEVVPYVPGRETLEWLFNCLGEFYLPYYERLGQELSRKYETTRLNFDSWNQRLDTLTVDQLSDFLYQLILHYRDLCKIQSSIPEPLFGFTQNRREIDQALKDLTWPVRLWHMTELLLRRGESAYRKIPSWDDYMNGKGTFLFSSMLMVSRSNWISFIRYLDKVWHAICRSDLNLIGLFLCWLYMLYLYWDLVNSHFILVKELSSLSQLIADLEDELISLRVSITQSEVTGISRTNLLGFMFGVTTGLVVGLIIPLFLIWLSYSPSEIILSPEVGTLVYWQLGWENLKYGSWCDVHHVWHEGSLPANCIDLPRDELLSIIHPLVYNSCWY